MAAWSGASPKPRWPAIWAGGGVEFGIWPYGVVVEALGRQHRSGWGQRGKQRFDERNRMQLRVAQAAIEALHEGIFGLPVGCDVMLLDLPLLRRTQDGCRGELGVIVADNQEQLGALTQPRRRLACDTCAGQ